MIIDCAFDADKFIEFLQALIKDAGNRTHDDVGAKPSTRDELLSGSPGSLCGFILHRAGAIVPESRLRSPLCAN